MNDQNELDKLEILIHIIVIVSVAVGFVVGCGIGKVFLS